MNRIKSGGVISFVAVSVTVMSWLVNGTDLIFKPEVHNINTDDNTGRAIKCDPNDTTKVSVSWTPRQLSPSGQVEIFFSYQAPHDMNGGFMNASLYFHGESEPFVGYSNVFTCDEVKSFLPVCKMRKKRKFAFPYNITYLHPLTSFPGDYDVIIDIRNEKNERMLCLNFTLYVNEI